jgi:hypothetical protein
MLDENLTVTDMGTGLANVGSTGSREFRLVAPPGADGSTVRRYAPTSMTSRSELRIAHQITGKNWNQRTRTLVQKIFTKIDQDTDVTGGVIPRATVGITYDRPSNMGSIYTDAILKSEIGYILALFLTSGNIDKLINLEA